MTTVRKTLTNRHNAASSTGPRSLKGKALASQNAQVHGLKAQKGLMPWELDEQYKAMKASFWEELAPMGPVEEMLVAGIVRNRWRLEMRLPQFEVGVLCQSVVNVFRSRKEDEKLFNYAPLPNDEGAAMSSREFEAMEITTLGAALMRSANTHDYLDRYRRSPERSIANDLDRLRSLRASKKNNKEENH